MVEFTRVDHDFIVPMLCAVAGSITINRLLELRLQAQQARSSNASSELKGAAISRG